MKSRGQSEVHRRLAFYATVAAFDVRPRAGTDGTPRKPDLDGLDRFDSVRVAEAARQRPRGRMGQRFRVVIDRFYFVRVGKPL